METNREDFGIAIRSAFLKKGVQQRFSLFVLVIISLLLLLLERVETKPLNYFRSIVKDTIYRGSEIISLPTRSLSDSADFINNHIKLYSEYNSLKKENDLLKNKISSNSFLSLENSQLRKLINEDSGSPVNFVSSRVMIDKQSPYLNSFIINSGSNKNIKNGMEVLDGKYFIGRIVDVNFFSSRVLLVSDLNSKVPVIIENSGNQAILSGRGNSNPMLEYLPENHTVQAGNIVYTSGKEGIFTPGVPIGEVVIKENILQVLLFSDLSQITFININIGKDK
jgi:rod shape-determining protein MreC